jgi:hypothetical protein
VLFSTSAHCGGHSPSGKFWLELIFSAHMNAMVLKISVGTEKMCMFNEPAGFWPNIFINLFWGLSKSHYLVT